ncbi:Gag protein [Operophtera brumata]|uniref:Gag protein n=1 Tax=Operophtera brumata TaxID=104452 RepID=A0A0L7KWU0_OPEBR|nr:Gag protein [Operophtera brumata]
MKPPKAAAIVLLLQPEAAERGVTYSAILQTAHERVNLQELGIEQLGYRCQSATGKGQADGWLVLSTGGCIRGASHALL